MRILPILLLVHLMVLFPAAALAEPAQLEVSVLAHGAKFIGDGTGGARITISDARTGEVLVEGITQGGTGDTELIMRREQSRWTPVTSDGAASFQQEFDLSTPRHLAITAAGPLDADPEDRVRATLTTWLLPGESRAGDRRVVLELSGYLVDVLEVEQGEDGIHATVDIGMLCGCPVVPGGLWDADRIAMQAILQGPEGETVVDLQHVEGTRYSASFERSMGSPGFIEFRLRGMDDSNVAVKRQPLQ